MNEAILPPLNNENDPEMFIGFLKEVEGRKGSVSNEVDNLNIVLNDWRNKIIDTPEAIKRAKDISAGRQASYH